MTTRIRRRAAVALVAAIAAFPIVGATPVAASESDSFIYSEACPEGYKGTIVGYNHPKFGSNAVYACTNII